MKKIYALIFLTGLPLIVWMSWLFRFHSIGNGLFLDRWRGEVVDYYGDRTSVIALYEIRNIPTHDEFMKSLDLIDKIKNEHIDKQQLNCAEFGAFADLEPKCKEKSNSTPPE